MPMPEWMRAATGDPQHGAEARQIWDEHEAFRAAFATPDEARAVRELFPGGAADARAMKELFPGGIMEARTLRQASQAVDQLDAAIYSGDARAQSEVVAELARTNPAALRQMFNEAERVLARLDPQSQHGGVGSSAANRAGGDASNAQSGREAAAQVDQRDIRPAANRDGPAPNVSQSVSQFNATGQPGANQGAPAFDAAAYAAFERSTNDTVARDVRGAVAETLARVLPEGMSEGAARRIGEDIFNEIHRTLAADRTLSEQVGEVLRGWRFGAGEQQRVAAMLTSRAKNIVPGIARRTIGEWTSSVLGVARSRSARQAAASARVDIATPGESLGSTPVRGMSAREVHYASMSDDDILAG